MLNYQHSKYSWMPNNLAVNLSNTANTWPKCKLVSKMCNQGHHLRPLHPKATGLKPKPSISLAHTYQLINHWTQCFMTGSLQVFSSTRIFNSLQLFLCSIVSVTNYGNNAHFITVYHQTLLSDMSWVWGKKDQTQKGEEKRQRKSVQVCSDKVCLHCKKKQGPK